MRLTGTTKRGIGYEAQLCVRREVISLGMYDTAEQAHEIWKIAKKNKDLYNRENKDWFRETIVAYEKHRKLRDRAKGYTKRYGKYVTTICILKHKIYIGAFDSEEKALRVYGVAKSLIWKYRDNAEHWRELVIAKALT